MASVVAVVDDNLDLAGRHIATDPGILAKTLAARDATAARPRLFDMIGEARHAHTGEAEIISAGARSRE